MNKLFGIPMTAALAIAMGAGLALAEPETEATAGPASVDAPAEAESPALPAAQNQAEAVDEEVAGIFARIPHVRAVADINGLKAWVAPGQNLVFMRNAETGSYIVGFPFDADGKTLIPGAAGVEGSGIDTLLSELFTPSISIPETYAPTVEERLSGLTEQERAAAIDGLIEAVRDVKDEAGFNAAIEAWLEKLPKPSEAADDSETGNEAAGTEGENEEAAADMPEGPTLIDAVRNAAYVEIGDRTAPLAYVILDPSCHPCRAALAGLKDRVDAGELQLRAILLPAVDADSPGVIAGLAATDDIGSALMGLGGEADAELPYERPSRMTDAVASGIAENLEMARSYQLPSLPFFIFENAEGPVYIAGLPSVEQFEGIILADADKSLEEGTEGPAEEEAETDTEEPADTDAPAE